MSVESIFVPCTTCSQTSIVSQFRFFVASKFNWQNWFHFCLASKRKIWLNFVRINKRATHGESSQNDEDCYSKDIVAQQAAIHCLYRRQHWRWQNNISQSFPQIWRRMLARRAGWKVAKCEGNQSFGELFAHSTAILMENPSSIMLTHECVWQFWRETHSHRECDHDCTN